MLITNKQLVLKAKVGSSEALQGIYEKYEEDLFSLAFNLLRDNGAAEDVVHDVFVSFTKSLHRFHLTGSLKSYLSTCTANLARDNIRRTQRRNTVELKETLSIVSESREPDQAAIFKEELQQLSDALARLPYPQRETIILHHQAGLSLRQIARMQKISLDTIKSRYRYALNKLRTRLNDEQNHETQKQYKNTNSPAAI